MDDGSKGAAFLYARREVRGLLEPLVASWGWNPDEPDPKGLRDPWGLARFIPGDEEAGLLMSESRPIGGC